MNEQALPIRSALIAVNRNEVIRVVNRKAEMLMSVGSHDAGVSAQLASAGPMSRSVRPERVSRCLLPPVYQCRRSSISGRRSRSALRSFDSADQRTGLPRQSRRSSS